MYHMRRENFVLRRGEEVRNKNKANAERALVKEIKSLKEKNKIKLGSGWTNKTDSKLEKMLLRLREEYNE